MRIILDFLEQLEPHNTVERMHAHQPEYKAAKQALLDLSQTCIDRIGAFDKHITDLHPKETIFRLARDRRFSKDKSPYKTNMGIVIAPGGKKSIFPCYYIHLQPGNRSFLAGGLYRPEKNIQTAVRNRLVTDRKSCQTITANPVFTDKRGAITGDQYKRPPRGYDAQHPAIALIKHKDWLVTHPLSDKQVISNGFIDSIIDEFTILHPFNTRLHQAIVQHLKENNDQ